MEKRKHKRTRFTTVLFSATSKKSKQLKPGTHQIELRDEYVGRFVVNRDHTVEFYGDALTIKSVAAF